MTGSPAEATTDVPKADATEANVSAKTSPVATVDTLNVKYTFHYQFKEGKLMLYGAFEKTSTRSSDLQR